MSGEPGRAALLPLLPSGRPIFEGLPLAAVVLDRLAPAVGDGIITIQDDARICVIIVRSGTLADVVCFEGADRFEGPLALARIRDWPGAAVSASSLDEPGSTAVAMLMNGAACYTDLRLEWTAWHELLADLAGRESDFVIELTTPTGRGVTIVQAGRQTATYTDAHPELGEPALLDPLVAPRAGTIRVLRAGAASTVVVPDALGKPAAEDAPQPSRIVPLRHRPAVPAGNPANGDATTFAAMFGTRPDGGADAVPASPRSDPRHDDLGELLPELKLLARSRLQRSADRVETLLDGAAGERRSIEWIADRVRGLSIRGVVRSSLDSLANDMVTLAERREG